MDTTDANFILKLAKPKTCTCCAKLNTSVKFNQLRWWEDMAGYVFECPGCGSSLIIKLADTQYETEPTTAHNKRTTKRSLK